MESGPSAARGKVSPAPSAGPQGSSQRPELMRHPLPQCVDSKGNVIALWETSQLADPFAAKLTIKHAALPIITEIVTTLTLNRIAQVSNWQ